jgi:hypothetical protein
MKVDPSLMKNERALLAPDLGTHIVETLTKIESLAMRNREESCWSAIAVRLPKQPMG